ncbi:MAG: hypothetical protein K8T20_03940, partial [Planctomycetes bacterium]|nr:hypothetical protein [Planctomycetota bacterium]
MRLKAILSGILGLALTGPTFGDPQAGGQESFPEGVEGVAEEPEVDVAAKLEEINEIMKQAERDLAGISDWRATDAQGRAIDELSRMFDGARQRQDSAIQSLEQLIKAAAEKSGKTGDKLDPSRTEKDRPPTKL